MLDDIRPVALDRILLAVLNSSKNLAPVLMSSRYPSNRPAYSIPWLSKPGKGTLNLYSMPITLKSLSSGRAQSP